jgi:hypothetical protein
MDTAMTKEYSMNHRIGHLVVVIILAAGGSASAHHGFRIAFDDSKKYTLTGTLTKVDWRNPHIELTLDVKRDHEETEAWVIQAAPPVFFARRNVSKTVFATAVGQPITIEAYRARDGRRSGSLLKITFRDGTSVTNDPSV